jgi:hypothetical protein
MGFSFTIVCGKKKKNMTYVTKVLRREEVNGRNCELLMETR